MARRAVARSGRPVLGWLRFAFAEGASTALEFALVGPILVIMLLIIIENGLMLFAQAILDNATINAARQIQIGTVTTGTAFRSAVCANMSTFLNCANLQFYVASSPSGFPAAVMPSSGGIFPTSSFVTGSGGDYVLAEVAYDRTYVSPWLINLDPSGWVLLSTQAFRNEPFS